MHQGLFHFGTVLLSVAVLVTCFRGVARQSFIPAALFRGLLDRGSCYRQSLVIFFVTWFQVRMRIRWLARFCFVRIDQGRFQCPSYVPFFFFFLCHFISLFCLKKTFLFLMFHIVIPFLFVKKNVPHRAIPLIFVIDVGTFIFLFNN